MINTYCTSDIIHDASGGGIVTAQESEALSNLGQLSIIDGNTIKHDNVFMSDYNALQHMSMILKSDDINISHFYAGTFSSTIALLKAKGVKVTYTAAAHNIKDSVAEYKKLGIDFNYPHLTDKKMWDTYVRGYIESDICVCPSTHSAKIIEEYGCKKVVVIPHGCGIPKTTKVLPKTFTVGYLGAIGPDKGIIYLLKAWEKLDLKDSKLIIAGKYSTHALPYVRNMKKGNIQLKGWIPNVSDFYNDISLYVQPSVTEGFGIEVIEAMAHGRPVIASNGCGAHECVKDSGLVFEKRNIDQLAEHIYSLYNNQDMLTDMSIKAFNEGSKYSWHNIMAIYEKMWSEL